MNRVTVAIAATAMLASGACFAQGTQGNRAGTAGTMNQSVTPGNMNRSATPGNNNQSAASGDTNQAVATTSANASQPAKGANSFTAGQARSRIESDGYTNVTDLRKDNDGVWHGKAQKNGQQSTVWLDYKGNVGQGQPQ